MMIAGHDQNVQNASRKPLCHKKCLTILVVRLFFLHHANHFNYTIYVRVCLLKMPRELVFHLFFPPALKIVFIIIIIFHHLTRIRL